MDDRTKKDLVEEEAFIISRGGEIPEVILHGAIHHLTEDPEGPGLTLDPGDIRHLKEAVIECYRRIIHRDLAPENRDNGRYRGLARCKVNMGRLSAFAGREGIDISTLMPEFAGALRNFLERELHDVKRGKRKTCINCTFEEIIELASTLGILAGKLPEGLRNLCQTFDTPQTSK